MVSSPAVLNFTSYMKRTLAVACLALASGAWAAPDAPPAPAPAQTGGEQIMGMLSDRGLLKPIENSAIVRSVRDTASDLVMSAMNFLGVPYRLGGNTNDTGFDCSGFTRHIFESSIGLVLPRRADEQARTAGLMSIHRDQLKPGDLVFFNTMRRTFSHVGIYLGDDKFIHAPRTGALVRIDDMSQSYWSTRFTGARRADPVTASTTLPAVR